MAYRVYSYKFRSEIPLLDEEEWSKIQPVLLNPIQAIKDYREKTGCGLKEAREWYETEGAPEGIQIYYEMTGQKLDRYEELFAVKLGDYGALCPKCEKPFRTPKAKLCVECGFELLEGQVAGQLEPEAIQHLKIK